MKRTILGSLMLTCIVIGAVSALMLLSTSDIPQVISSFGQRGWNTIASAEEGGGTVGAAAGGVLQVYIWRHSAAPGTDYAANLSNVSANCFAWANNLNAAMTGNVPYATAFDIVYKIRVNVTEAYNTTGLKWELAWVRANITCANLAIGADTAMSEVEIVHNTVFMWVNYYVNNGGAGYTITHGQQVNITSFKLQAWY
jgi:hypothetical protein